jgi:subtilisin family serine protease
VPVLASGNYRAATGEDLSANYGNLDAVVVGATTRTGDVSWFSTPLGNAKWGIVAPGGGADHKDGDDVLVPVPGGGYTALAGTSFAAPHVTGALALLLAQGLTAADAVTRLIDSADHGRLDVAAAVAPAPAAPVVTTRRQVPAADEDSSPAPWAAVAVATVLLAGAVLGAVKRLS